MEMNQIGIYGGVVQSSLDEFAKTGHMYAVPYIIITVNDNTKYDFIRNPFRIYWKNMERRDFETVVGQEKTTQYKLHLPGEAYTEIVRYQRNNTDRVLADLAAVNIVETVNSLKQTGSDNVFFFNNFHSDKLISRLSYLYLNNKKNSFFFVYYKPDNLLTTLTNKPNDNLNLDIFLFENNNIKHALNRSDIFPNNVMESLLQTVFFSIESSEKQLLPLRLEVFSQGLQEVESKIGIAHEILSDNNNLCLPQEEGNFHVRIPKVLHKCIDADKERDEYIVEAFLREWRQKNGHDR